MNKITEWFFRRQMNKEVKKGTAMGKLWDWLNGKKTVIGLIITAIAWLSTFVPAVMAAIGSEPAQIAAVTGVFVTVLGIAHKIYKFLFREEHD